MKVNKLFLLIQITLLFSSFLIVASTVFSIESNITYNSKDYKSISDSRSNFNTVKYFKNKFKENSESTNLKDLKAIDSVDKEEWILFISNSSAISSLRKSILLKSLSCVGIVPYSQVGRSSPTETVPLRLDCSSFVAWSYTQGGVPMSQITTKDLTDTSKFIPISLDDIEPGDLLYRTGHVKIFLGKDNNGNNVYVHERNKESGCVITKGEDNTNKPIRYINLIN